MPATEHRDGIIVVGGGYAGLHAVRAAERHVDVTVVDRDGQHDFVTRLAAVAGGTAPRRDARQPLDRFVDDLVVAPVTAVHDGAIELADGRRLESDAVVVTAGAATSRPPIDGIEHATGLRTADDALALRDAIAAADSLVVIGGGATGVQLAGSVAHAHPDTTVHLIEAGPRLLSGLPDRLGAGAARILRGRRVRLHLGRPVERITADGVELDGREIIGLVVWAGGFAADAAGLGLPTTPDGRVAVGDDLRVSGMTSTFAAGDIAAHHDRRGLPLPMSAQVAVGAGTAAGRNAARAALGKPTEPADIGQLGWVLDLGGRRGVAQIGPIELGAPFADLVPPLLHDVIDLKNLIEIGGLAALRAAPEPVRSFLPTIVSDRVPFPFGTAPAA